VRIAQGRPRAAALVATVFALVTLLLNAPVAIEGIEGGAVQLREGWTWFFEFSYDRGPGATLWSAPDVGVAEANRWSGVLLGLGLAAVLSLTVRGVRRGQDVLLSAAGAALLWLLPPARSTASSYSLWTLLALALAGSAPESDDRRRGDRLASVGDALGRPALARRSLAGHPPERRPAGGDHPAGGLGDDEDRVARPRPSARRATRARDG